MASSRELVETQAKACFAKHKADSKVQADAWALAEFNFCFKCGDTIGEDTTHCSCDKPD